MNRALRHKRVRKKIIGTKNRPRLSVQRTLRGMSVQLIDDETGRTLFGISHKKITSPASKIAQAKELGLLIAKQAKKGKISKVVFDRGGYRYHGRIKALADGAREGGLKF